MVDFLDKNIEKGHHGHHGHHKHHKHHKKFYITCKSANIDKKKLTGDLHCKVVFYKKKKDRKRKISSKNSKSDSKSEDSKSEEKPQEQQL